MRRHPPRLLLFLALAACGGACAEGNDPPWICPDDTGCASVPADVGSFDAAVASGDTATAATGSLLVEWRVAGATCEQAGIEWLDVELLVGGATEPREVWDVARVRCDAGQTIVTAVRPGGYDVRILGYPVAATADGAQPTRADATYEGEMLGLVVKAGAVTRLASAIVLRARGGSIYLNWRFSNGMVCTANGVSEVEITIHDPFSNAGEPLRYDCDMGDYIASLPAEEAANVRGVFIDRLDSEPLTVEVIGFDADGTATHGGTVDFQVDPGEVRDLVVTLEPCGGSCR